MQPQGTGQINTAYYDNLVAQINAVPSCAGLQPVIDKAMASLAVEVSAIRAQIAALVPIITIPAANPAAIVAWITSFVAPYQTAHTNYISQLTQTLAQYERVAAAIAAAAARFTSCSVSVPTIV